MVIRSPAGGIYRINCLHIHSKNVAKFRSELLPAEFERGDLIDGEQFAALADFHFTPADEGQLSEFLANRRDGSAVLLFAATHDGNALLRALASFPNLQITLITHNSDGVVRDHAIRENDADFRLVPRNVVRWYAQNVEAVHPALVPIPIGLERDIWFPELRKKEQLLQLSRQPEPRSRKLLYINHDVRTHPEGRQIYDLFAGQPWVTCRISENGADYCRYINEIRSHHFIVSPYGNGIDCHRTWEALYLGCVPIVPRCHNNEKVYGDLPVLIVDDYEQVTEDLLRSYLASAPQRRVDKLKFAHYRAIIRGEG